MRIIDLITLVKDYLLLGIVAVLFVALLFFVGYFLIYKKVLKGQKQIKWKRLLWWSVLLCYIVVVLGATLLSRANGYIYEFGKILPLFYSYKEAWIIWSDTAWRNIILNFCMFVPLGIWLPIGLKNFQKFWLTYITGFVFSFIIELIQLLLGRGLFELDDLMGNTVGTMIGYGLYLVGVQLIQMRKKENTKKVSQIVIAQIPLMITVFAFSFIFLKYSMQGLGNNPYQYIEAYDKNRITVSGKNDFSTTENRLMVYETKELSLQEATDFGRETFKNLGTTIDDERTEVYEDTLVLFSDTGRYSLWVNYMGGTYDFTDYDVIFPDETTAELVLGADEATIRAELKKFGIEIPVEAEFEELDEGNYQFYVPMIKTDHSVKNGTLVCRYYGEAGIGSIRNNIFTCESYKEYTVISEQKAYQKIVNGEFIYGLARGNLDIQVDSCEMVYDVDSKGYYQPNYQFHCVVNGEETFIQIPALEK